MKKISLLVMALSLLLTIGASDSFAQKKKTTAKKPVAKKPVLKKASTVKAAPVASAVKLYTVDQGQVIRVRMNGSISSKTAKIGQTFNTTVTEPVYSNGGHIVVPVGSTVVGKITAVTPAAKGGKPGTIDVDFIEIRLPTNAKYAINGDLTELESKTAKSDNEGAASGSKMNHRKVIFVGGGGAGGAIIGGAIGGGLGAAIGAGAGALGGLILENQTKGGEVDVKANSEFGVHLNRAVSMPKYTGPMED